MSARIMIVEDEVVIIHQLEAILADLGYEICCKATSGEKAIPLVKDCQPDLILMDINLIGEMDGTETAQEILRHWDIPIIYATAFADPEVLERAKVTSPYGYILKPFNDRELQVAIEIALYKHQAEKEKAALQAQLYQAKAMEKIATLAGGLAHNFNNILWAVMGFTELTMAKMPEYSKDRQNLQQAMKSCDRAKDIINQFLIFSRQVEPQRQDIAIVEIIKESLVSLEESLPSNITVDLYIGCNPGFISANYLRLREMLGHLYANSLHAMQKKGGVLGIRLEEITLHEEQKIPGQNLAPGAYWKMIISDTGHGMDQETMDRIFDPFFTTKEVGSGLGLGLSVVYGIIRCHDGSISVTSEPGHGTAFSIFLPKKEN